MVFKSPKSSLSSKRCKSSMNFPFLPKHRHVRTKFMPIKPPHYFYNPLPNDSFATEVDDPRSPPSPSPTSSVICNNHRPTSAITLTLENSGSVARDHLASERTFLAYMRTSLAFASAGVGMSVWVSYILRFFIVFHLLGLVQLFTVATVASHLHCGHRLHRYIQPLGAAAIFLGLAVLIIGSLEISSLRFPNMSHAGLSGTVRYFTVQAALTKGCFPVARIMTALMTLSLTVLIILSFGILVTGKLGPTEKP